MYPRLLGLTGAAGSGKDTLADYIQGRRCVMSRPHSTRPTTGPAVLRYAFAAPIKLAISTMLQDAPDLWSDREWKEAPILGLGKSPRHLAQTLGTEWGRTHVHRDFWLFCAARWYAEVGRQAEDGVIITDVRFDNEADWIHDRGGYVVQIIRQDAPEVAAHVSEAGIDPNKVDQVVYNNGTVEDFGRKALQLIEKLGNG